MLPEGLIYLPPYECPSAVPAEIRIEPRFVCVCSRGAGREGTPPCVGMANHGQGCHIKDNSAMIPHTVTEWEHDKVVDFNIGSPANSIDWD